MHHSATQQPPVPNSPRTSHFVGPDPTEDERFRLATRIQANSPMPGRFSSARKASSSPWSGGQRLMALYWEQEFLILILAAIAAARAYPKLGTNYLHPEITSTWIAVVVIFILAGLGLKTDEIKKAFANLRFNVTVQCFSFFAVSGIVYGVSRVLVAARILHQDLADGMVACASLPMAINAVIVVTASSGGDDAAALFNVAAANLLGALVSPLLILAYLGVRGDADVVRVFNKLAVRIVLPVVFGQLLQRSGTVKDFVFKNRNSCKQVQQYCLVFIVYTVFCATFTDTTNTSSMADVALMIVCQFLLLTSIMALAWTMLRTLFPDDPELCVTGLFGCTFKTVSMGVPLINAMYEGNASLGQYTLPLLVWHPMQLVLGSMLAPHMAAFVQREEERLGEHGVGLVIDETTSLIV